jgi:hypothetical protein
LLPPDLALLQGSAFFKGRKMTVIAIELAIIAVMLVLIHKQQVNNTRREKLIKKTWRAMGANR